MKLRIVSYNVRACRGMARRVSVERVAQVLAALKPDIVALQEVDMRRKRTGTVDQAHQLGERLGMEHCFFPARRWAGSGYGNAVLSHLPLEVCKLSLLPRPRGMPVETRCALHVKVELPGGELLNFVNTHLGLLAFERVAQVRFLLQSLPVGPTVLCGDLNARPGSKEILLLGSALKRADTPRTFPAQYPIMRLDHVFHSPELAVTQSHAPRTQDSRLASDHLPLVVDFEVDL